MIGDLTLGQRNDCYDLKECIDVIGDHLVRGTL